jgi:glycosyltransferase involved in cell wall biosynthesis
LKILQLSKFYPPVLGGIESVAFELTEGMNRLGFTIDVLCANTTSRTSHDQSASGYRIIRAGSWGKLLSTSIAPAMLTEAKRLFIGKDIVHVHMPDPMAAFAVWMAKPRGKVVLHWHSDVVNQRRALKLYEPLQEWLLRRADAVIATSAHYVQSSTCLQAWKSKVHIIPIGISEDSRPDATSKAQALRERFIGKKIVFSLGRMTYYKGFDVLIDAVSSLPADTVVLVGGGGELLEGYRRRVVAEGLSDRIEFVGRIPDEDVPGYFAAANVFCLSSIVRAEAYGVVLLEAMAMGKPIVTTDISGSGVPWVNQHGVTGLNVPVRNSDELAAALSRILEDAELSARFGSAGRQRFLSCFTSASMVDRTLELYRNLLKCAQ